MNHGPHQWCSGPRMMVQIWIYNPTVYECYMRYGPYLTGVDYPTDYGMTSNYFIHTQLLPWVLESRAWTIDLINGGVVQGWWHRYWYTIPLFHECYMRNGSCLTWVGHLTRHDMTSNYSPDILSCYPGYWNQDLEPCSSPVVWWSKNDDTGMDMLSHCFMSVIWGMHHVWQGCTTHRPQHDHQLHPRHAQLLPWFSEPRAWTIDLIGGVVVQGWWRRYGYAIPPFYECCLRHGPYLTGLDQ